MATTEGCPLPLSELAPGTYLLEANGIDLKRSTMVVIQYPSSTRPPLNRSTTQRREYHKAVAFLFI